MPAANSPVVEVYQMKVTLKQSRPPIWRRIQIADNTTLAKLHRVLQIVMGWYDCHLHQFVIGGAYFGVPDREFADFGPPMMSEGNVRLHQVVVNPKMRFTYEYDFGDDWGHAILVEKILEPNPTAHYPVCLAGARCCPPEDCGGIWGYGELLQALQDPNHEQHEELVEWVGGEFDPERFDLEAINRRLKRFR